MFWPTGGSGVQIERGPDGTQMCVNGVCHALKNGYTIDGLGSPSYWPISDKAVSKVAAMKDVTAAAGGLLLTDNRTTISSNLPLLTSFTLDGADISQLKLGPLSDAAVSSGRAFTASDADKDVALVDQGYAASSGLKVGGTMKIGGTTFTIIGLVEQPEGSSPPDVYIPLARAQAVTEQDPVAAAGCCRCFMAPGLPPGCVESGAGYGPAVLASGCHTRKPLSATRGSGRPQRRTAKSQAAHA